jgi:TonB family protein
MKEKIFKNFQVKTSSTKKWLFLPISFLLHVLIIASFIVLPIMTAPANLPLLKTTDVLINIPTLPVRPGVPVKKGTKGSIKKKNEKNKSDQIRRPSGKLIAPVEIPQDIKEEIPSFGDGYGYNPNGIVGGFDEVEGGTEIPQWMKIDPAKDGIPVTVLQKPRLIKKVVPHYPELAIKVRRQGKVIIEATTDIYGKVTRIRIISGDPLLNKAASEAIRQWIFEPYLINGFPKPVKFCVTINFNLTGTN